MSSFDPALDMITRDSDQFPGSSPSDWVCIRAIPDVIAVDPSTISNDDYPEGPVILSLTGMYNVKTGILETIPRFLNCASEDQEKAYMSALEDWVISKEQDSASAYYAAATKAADAILQGSISSWATAYRDTLGAIVAGFASGMFHIASMKEVMPDTIADDAGDTLLLAYPPVWTINKVGNLDVRARPVLIVTTEGRSHVKFDMDGSTADLEAVQPIIDTWTEEINHSRPPLSLLPHDSTLPEGTYPLRVQEALQWGTSAASA